MQEDTHCFFICWVKVFFSPQVLTFIENKKRLLQISFAAALVVQVITI